MFDLAGEYLMHNMHSTVPYSELHMTTMQWVLLEPENCVIVAIVKCLGAHMNRSTCQIVQIKLNIITKKDL